MPGKFLTLALCLQPLKEGFNGVNAADETEADPYGIPH